MTSSSNYGKYERQSLTRRNGKKEDLRSKTQRICRGDQPWTVAIWFKDLGPRG